MTDPWEEQITRLLRDKPRAAVSAEPTATEELAYVGMTVAKIAAYAIILIAPLAFWIMTP